MKKSLYATLGVDPKAGDSAIRAAYESQLATTSPDDKVRQLALKEALNVLGHAQRRAVYDASLQEQAAREAAAQRTAERGGARSGPRSGTPGASRAATAPEPRSAGVKLLWVSGAIVIAALGWMVARSHKAPKPAAQTISTQTLAADQPHAGGTAATPGAAPAPTAEPDAPEPSGPALKPEALFARLSPSIVRINVLDQAGNGIAIGSGVVIDRATVITNCHVAQAGPRLKVKHQDGVLDASLVLADEEHDLCKLSVLGLEAPAVEQSRLKHVKVGQKVYALGAPQGLDLTLSDGMVSSLRKFDDGSVIQTSAPVSPGSSGGGLFNEYGQLIGIVTFQMRSGQNLNFAVPVDWIGAMSPTHLADGERFGEPADSRPARTTPGQAVNPDILGTWHCFGPLTGWSMDVTLDAQGRVNGKFNNKPLSGYFQLNNKQLNLMGDRFLVEELSPSRMVLSLGQGARLACSH